MKELLSLSEPVINILVLVSICMGAPNDDTGQICYERLGCFDMGPPWCTPERPVPRPHPPDQVGTRVYFYSQEEPKRVEILIKPEVNLNGASYKSFRKTIIIIHGYRSSGNTTWVKRLKNAYLKTLDVNIMLIDWGPGAQTLNYVQALSNTRVVGREVSRLLQSLKTNPSTVHIVGHSLGAQAAAYVGNEMYNNIMRITGLDVAQPGFEGYDKKVRLNADDAIFVDTIHTDARPTFPLMGFGYIETIGDVDFYMNGGSNQPGCFGPINDEKAVVLLSPNNIEGLKMQSQPGGNTTKFIEAEASAISDCDHSRSHEYFIEAISNAQKGGCIFWGHEVSPQLAAKITLKGFVAKLTAIFSITCSRINCVPVGIQTPNYPARGAFEVITNATPPYCDNESPSTKAHSILVILRLQQLIGNIVRSKISRKQRGVKSVVAKTT